MVDLEVAPGDKVGIVLDSIHVDSISLSGMSPIVVSLVSPGSVAARDRRLGRGDQVLEINGHSLRLASLERARYAFINNNYSLFARKTQTELISSQLQRFS